MTVDEEEISFTSFSSVVMIVVEEKGISSSKTDLLSSFSSFVDKEEITIK